MKYASLFIFGMIAVIAIAGIANNLSATGKATEEFPVRPLHPTTGGSYEEQQIFRSGYPQMLVVGENNLPNVESPMPSDIRGKYSKSRPQQIVVVVNQQ